MSRIETNLRIQSVVYQSGIVEGLRDVHKIERQTVSGDDLTEEIRDLLLLSGAAFLDGTYGDPFTASPIQYDRIAVRTQNDTAVTVCYNRAYNLFRKDSDDLRAIHEALERLNRMTGYKSSPVSPARKRARAGSARGIRIPAGFGKRRNALAAATRSRSSITTDRMTGKPRM